MSNNINDLLFEKKQILDKIRKTIHGSIEIRENNSKKYIYVSYRDEGQKINKYVGVFNNDLYNLILENNDLVKDLKKRLRIINKILKENSYKDFNLSDKVKQNIDLARRYIVDTIYNQSRLEGIATTYADTMTIIEGGKIKDMPVIDIKKILNLKAAWDFVLSEGALTYPTNINILEEINSIVQYGFSQSAGSLRIVPVKITGTNYVPPLPIRSIMIEDLEKILSSQDDDYTKAVKLMLFISKVQPFIDGNKRTALIFANHYLISKGKGIISIPVKFIDEYRKYLIEYYESETDDAIKFVLEKCIVKI